MGWVGRPLVIIRIVESNLKLIQKDYSLLKNFNFISQALLNTQVILEENKRTFKINY